MNTGASLHSLSGRLALDVCLSRARVYLIRARKAGQNARMHRNLGMYKHRSYNILLAQNHAFNAKQNRHQARLMLQEAERIVADKRSYNGTLPKWGARLLGGANFLSWSEYKAEFADGCDFYIKDEFDARRKPK